MGSAAGKGDAGSGLDHDGVAVGQGVGRREHDLLAGGQATGDSATSVARRLGLDRAQAGAALAHDEHHAAAFARGTASAGTLTPAATGAASAAGAGSRKDTRTPMSGTMRGSRSRKAMRTFTVALLRSAVGTIAITSAGMRQSG